MSRRRPTPPSHPEERVPWASFADALTGLLFVFILLALSFAWQLQQAKAEHELQRDRLEEQVERALRGKEVARELVSTERAGATAEYSVALCLQEGLPEGGEVWVEPSPNRQDASLSLYLMEDSDGMTVEWFESGRATLQNKPCRVAREIGPCLLGALEHPDLASGDLGAFSLRVFVEGHTDYEPVKATQQGLATNWELSGARAAAVVRALLMPQAATGCRADAETARVLQGRIANEDLDVIAVGLAERRPAWQRVCEVEPEDPVCSCMQDTALGIEACAPALQEVLVDHVEELPQSAADRLIAWANLTGQRRAMQRRVDLRFEVSPRFLEEGQ